MWARPLPLACPWLPTCEYNTNSSCHIPEDKELGQKLKPKVGLNVYGYIISTVIGCWFLAGWSCSCLGTGCLYSRRALASRYVNSTAPSVCKIDKCNDSVRTPCSCSTRSSNTTCCIRKAAKPNFRVKDECRVVSVYLLNVGFCHSFCLHRFSLLGKFCLFEFCRHSFHISRFLLKYFKYFKGSGVRI